AIYKEARNPGNEERRANRVHSMLRSWIPNFLDSLMISYFSPRLCVSAVIFLDNLPNSSLRIGQYFKAAFFYHWNLLAFLGGSVFALLTPIPDVVLALIAAGEVAYLGLLGTHPKFQSYVEAQDAKAAREATSLTSQQALERITASLPKELLDRFMTLRG